MNRKIALAAACLGFSAVLLGAIGAHALKQRVGPQELEVWKTAALYHALHAVALLALAAWRTDGRWGVWAGRAWVAGVGVFSGSLYLLVLSKADLGMAPAGWLGAITPIGGVLLMAGWAMAGVAGWHAKR